VREELYFRELAHGILGVGKSKICRADLKARNSRKN